MYLGNQVNYKESVENEFKEFCTKVSLHEYYSSDEMYDIIKTGKLNSTFNSMILDNLQLYFDLYVPKYASAFSNSHIHGGNVKIGINDYGEVTGIPFLGTLTTYTVKEMIKKTELNYCCTPLDITVKVKKMKVNTNLLSDNVDEYIDRSKKKNELYNLIHNKYYGIRSKWVNEVLMYSVKLSSIIQNKTTRESFYNWLKNQDISHDMLIKCISTSPQQVENIQHKRKYITDPTSVIYWIAKYKDFHMENLQSMKPEPPNMLKKYNYPLYLLTHLTDLRSRFIKHNKKLNYYVIVLFYNNTNTKQTVMYNKPNKKYTYMSYRTTNSNGPFCITNVTT